MAEPRRVPGWVLLLLVAVCVGLVWWLIMSSARR